MHIQVPQLDLYSFVLGSLITFFLLWMIFLLQAEIRKFRDTRINIFKIHKSLDQSFVALENNYRHSIYLKAQNNHLSSPIFPLDDIVIPPRFYAEPLKTPPGTETSNMDVFSVIPYTPGISELSSAFKKPTINLSDILDSRFDFMIIGQPGMGKSVALGYCTSRIAKSSPEIPTNKLVPFSFHISEIPYHVDRIKPIELLTKNIIDNDLLKKETAINEFVNYIFVNNRAILLIDGMDELVPEEFNIATKFIATLKETYPNTQIITTATPDYMDGLITLNFIPITIAAWSDDEIHNLFSHWENQWTDKVSSQRGLKKTDYIDPLLIFSWLQFNYFLSPFEITLGLWGAFIGDLFGQRISEIISAYISRCTPSEILGRAIEELAAKSIMSETQVLSRESLNKWFQQFSTSSHNEECNSPEQGEYEISNEILGGINFPVTGISSVLSSGIFISTNKENVRFSHPIITSFLACQYISPKYIEDLTSQPRWIGRDITLNFYSINYDLSTYIAIILKQSGPPLFTDLLSVSRWLKDIPNTYDWPRKVISRLFSFIQDDSFPLSLRCDALCSLLRLGKIQEIQKFFLSIQESKSTFIQQLGALGSGALKDHKSISSLSSLIYSPVSQLRNAACLALATIGSRESLDALALLLLNGDEFQRKAAAEALSVDIIHGHDILKEAASMKGEFLVRRAAVFGIRLIKESWATILLSLTQQEDPEWLVRSAAAEVLESQNNVKSLVSPKLPPAAEAPWLIAYAGKQGVGVVPNKFPLELLLDVLQSGSLEEKIASLSYLSAVPIPKVIHAMYHFLYKGDSELQEATYLTLRNMAARGIELPVDGIVDLISA